MEAICRQHNVVEYKSPEDHLNVDDFYEVYGYACTYKTEVEKVNQIPDRRTDDYVCVVISIRGGWYEIFGMREIQNVTNIEHGVYYTLWRCSSNAAYYRTGIVSRK